MDDWIEKKMASNRITGIERKANKETGKRKGTMKARMGEEGEWMESE